jgi:hypothetical protein
VLFDVTFHVVTNFTFARFPVLNGLLNNAGTFDGDYTGKRPLAPLAIWQPLKFWQILGQFFWGNM